MRKTALLTVLIATVMVVPIAAFAFHSFTDVSDSTFFHNSVAWMKDNGITVGCNPPSNTKYCPNDNVSRGEMAVFLKRLAEFNVVDAGELQGFTAAQLTPRAAFNSTGNAPDGADFTLSTTITAPAPGILLLSATIDAANFAVFNIYKCFLEINNGLVSGTLMFAQLDGDTTTNNEEDCTTSGAAAVAAGTHTIDFKVADVAPSTELFEASVWVLWVPLDGTGAIPTSISQLGQTTPGIDERPTD